MRGASLRAYDKMTGAQVGEVRVPAPVVGHADDLLDRRPSVHRRRRQRRQLHGRVHRVPVAGERTAPHEHRGSVAATRARPYGGTDSKGSVPFCFCVTLFSELLARRCRITPSALAQLGLTLIAIGSAIIALSSAPWLGAAFPLATMFTAVALSCGERTIAAVGTAIGG